MDLAQLAVEYAPVPETGGTGGRPRLENPFIERLLPLLDGMDLDGDKPVGRSQRSIKFLIPGMGTLENNSDAKRVVALLNHAGQALNVTVKKSIGQATSGEGKSLKVLGVGFQVWLVERQTRQRKPKD